MSGRRAGFAGAPGRLSQAGNVESDFEGGPRGERAPPATISGCPDLNWGPLRPERSALPGCATPRLVQRLSHRVGAALVSGGLVCEGFLALPEADELGSFAAWPGEGETHGAERADGE